MDRPDRIDDLVPIGWNAHRNEVELLDPDPYLARPSPPFLDHFLRGEHAVDAVVAADVDDYLAWFAEDSVGPPLVHLFMVNRCGSTALINALARHPGVAAFNELDPWVARVADGDEALASALDLAFARHLRGWGARRGQRVVLKHRGDTSTAPATVLAASPDASVVFLIRHFDAVIASQLRREPGAFPGTALAQLRRVAPSALRWNPALPAMMYAALYVDAVAAYRELARHHPARCLRYEVFVRDPDVMLRAVLAHVGLPADAATAAAMRDELAHDAKERAGGTTAPFSPAAPPAPVDLPQAIRAELEAAWAALPGELVDESESLQ